MSRFVAIKKVGAGWEFISGTGPTGTTGPSGPATTGSGDITYIMSATSISGSYTGTDDYRLIFASGANVTVSLPYPEDEGRIYTIVNNSETLASVYGGLEGSWVTGPVASYEDWTDMTYGTGYFVAVNDNTGNPMYVYYSSNGVSWSLGASLTNGVYKGIAYGSNRFVAIAPSTYWTYSASPVLSWTVLLTFLTSPSNWTALAYGDNKFVAVAAGPTSTGAYLSGTGTVWSGSYMGTSRSWSDIGYGQGAFVAIPSGTRTGAYSSDGINWSDMVTPFTSYGRTLAFGNDIFVAFSGTTPIYSNDGGINWFTGYSVGSSISSVAFYDGEFVAVGGTNVSYHSTNGIYWQAKTVLTSVAHTVAGSGTGSPGVSVLSAGIVPTADFYSHVPWVLDKENNVTYIYNAFRWNRL